MFRLEVANYGLATCLDQTIDLTSMQLQEKKVRTINDEFKSWDAPMLFNSRSCEPQYVTSSILSNVNIAASWDHESARQYNLATNYALALALVENTRTKRSSSSADITELQPSSPQLLQTHSSWSNVSHYKSGETDYVRTTVGDIMNYTNLTETTLVYYMNGCPNNAFGNIILTGIEGRCL